MIQKKIVADVSCLLLAMCILLCGCNAFQDIFASVTTNNVLRDGVYGGNLALVQEVINAQPECIDDVITHSSGISQGPLLIESVRFGFLDIVEFLLKKGADPNATDSSGCSAFHIAAYSGSMELCQMLVDYGTSPSLQNKDGDSALELYIKNVTESAAENLISDDRVIETVDEIIALGNPISKHTISVLLTPEASDRYVVTRHILMVAEENGVDLDLDPLLQAGIKGELSKTTDFSAISKWSKENKQALLFYATAFGHPENLQKLQQQGLSLTETDAHMNSLLALAAAYNNTTMVEYIQKNSPAKTLNSKNKYGLSTLDMALYKGKCDNATYLLRAGASLSSTDVMDVHFADSLQCGVASGNIAVIQWIKDAGYQTNETNFGCAFNEALHHNDTDMAIRLFDLFEVSPNLYGHYGLLLSEACEYGNKEVAHHLLVCGANVNGEADDVPIVRAVVPGFQKQSINMVSFLLDNGANINERCTDMDTALLDAVKLGQIELIELLLEKGATVTEEVMEAAEEAKCENVLALLQAH